MEHMELSSARDVVASDLADISSRLSEEFGRMAGGRLLIVGGGGFLGYYLVQSVLHYNSEAARPISLTVFDNYIRGVPQWLKDLESDPNLELVRHDITDPLPESMADFDWIIHAASIASPIFYRRHPIATMDANVGGLRRLLDYCVDRKEKGRPVSGFLFYSTSEIYGDPTPDAIPTPETYRGLVSCTGPRACYDESKRFGETLCVNFAEQNELPITIARPFNNFGPGLKISDRRVIPDFARNVFNNEDISLLSDGSPTRTFCYIADAVTGYYKILVRGKAGEPYNIGVETPEISMYDLACRIAGIGREHFGYTGTVTRQTSPDRHYLTDNPNRRCPIIEKARTQLGYEPRWSIDDALLRTMLWYRDNRVAEDL
jgi:dTDP-glucose 4,6-dehydratase/UDP-glucuronate decarboxylase